MSTRKVHFRDTRLFVNAGLRYPLCRVSDRLDTDAARLKTSGDRAEVTCLACRRLFEAADRAPKQSADIRFSNQGSLWLISGLTDEGKAWLDEHVGDDETQYWCGAIVCEPRYVSNIIEGAREAGLRSEL